MDRVIAALGETDCEALGDGFLRQPANALSSLALSVFGGVLLATAMGADGLDRRVRLVIGWLLIATGVGSFLYHGPQWAGSHFLHDVTFLATIWVLAVMNATAALDRPERTGWIIAAAGSATAAAFLIAFPAWTNVLTGLAVVAFVAADLAGHRAGGVGGRWYAASIGLLVAAVAANVLGRTGYPGCAPESVLQLHGAWHVLAGAGITAYVLATAPVRERASRSRIATS